MNWNEYVPLAIRTAKPLEHGQQVDHALLGMITELGELADIIKRQDIYGKPLDRTHLKEEGGDFTWYVALYADTNDLQFEFVDSGMYRHMTNQGIIFEMTRLVGRLLETSRDIDTFILSYLLKAASTLLKRHDITLEDALDTNIAKLAARYGDKYSDYNALNRDLANERKVLEA